MSAVYPRRHCQRASMPRVLMTRGARTSADCRSALYCICRSSAMREREARARGCARYAFASAHSIAAAIFSSRATQSFLLSASRAMRAKMRSLVRHSSAQRVRCAVAPCSIRSDATRLLPYYASKRATPRLSLLPFLYAAPHELLLSAFCPRCPSHHVSVTAALGFS